MGILKVGRERSGTKTNVDSFLGLAGTLHLASCSLEGAILCDSNNKCFIALTACQTLGALPPPHAL